MRLNIVNLIPRIRTDSAKDESHASEEDRDRFFMAFSFDYLYVCRRTTKRRIDIDISAFLHFHAFVLNGRAYFGIACSRLCAIINAFQWIRQGRRNILGLAHRRMRIYSPFGCHIHLTSIPVYRTDFVRASCVFSGTLYLTDFSISHKFVFVNRHCKTFFFFSQLFPIRKRMHARFARIRKKYVKSAGKLLTKRRETTIIASVLLSLWQ